MADGNDDKMESHGQPGIGVDRFGGQVVDPTKNVADLVEAKAKSDAALREAEKRFLDAQLASMNKFNDFARDSDAKFNALAREAASETEKIRTQVERDAEIKFQNYAREAEARIQINRTDAETRRIDQLAETRQEFQNTIRDMLAESVRTTSTLVSTQLVQIQATFDTRVSKLEAQAFTAAGRSSVADPAIESAMTRMSQGISGLASSSADSMSKMAAANAEAMTKLTATMGAMQASAALAAGERGGHTQEAFASRDRDKNMLSFGMMAIAAVSLISTVGMGLYMAMRPASGPAIVYAQPADQPRIQHQSFPLVPTWDGNFYRIVE
jgi:hypothetical protein